MPDNIEWIDPYEGFAYREDTIQMDAAEQRRSLSACGLDPDVFGDVADPSFFILEAIQAGVRSGITSDGNVNMLQSLVQRRPVILGEPLTIKGRITAVDEVARGHTVDTDVSFDGADGESALLARRRTLKPDPAKSSARGAGERPPPVVEDPTALDTEGEYTLTPEIVRAYRSEGNPIHFDIEAAQAVGFRAPIIGGGMGVHYLMAALWRRFDPIELDVDIYFRRPIFWDDSFTLRVESDWRALCLAKGEKVLTEMRVNKVTPGAGARS